MGGSGIRSGSEYFDGRSFSEADYLKTFNQTLEYAKQLDPSLLTLHFPTDHADYVHEDHIKNSFITLRSSL